MKVLTLREPYASLIGEKIKLIETRSWATKYRGELYIHSGIRPILKKDKRANYLREQLKGELHYGKIFAKCKLVDCINIDEEFAQKVKEENYLNYYAGDYTVGRYAWIIEDVEYVEQRVAKGQLGLWNYNS